MEIDDTSSALILHSDSSLEIALHKHDDDIETSNNILISLLSILISNEDEEFWNLLNKKEKEIFGK